MVTIIDNSNNYAFNLTGTATNASFTGTSDADTITNAIDGFSIYGMSGADVITNSGSNVSISGGAGDDLFVLSAGTATITDYNNADNDSDTIQFASAPTFAISGNDVKFANNFVVSGAKGKFITTKVNDATTVAAYYENASINGGDKSKLILGASFSGTVKAGDYTIDSVSVTAVDASAVTGNKLTYDGFSTITGYKDGDKIAGTPTDAKTDGSDLLVTVGGSQVKVTGKTEVNLTAGDKTYTAANGIITDISNANAYSASLTNNYTGDYTAGASIVTVTAAGRSTAINITDNALDNSILGGAGSDSLTGGEGKDTFIMGGGTDTVTDYTLADDTIQVSSGANGVYNQAMSGVLFTNGDNTLLVKNNTTDKTKMLIKTASGTDTYYAGAHIDGDTLILESTFNFDSVSSANYAGVSKVSVASDVASTSITFDGFTSITGFRSSADKVVGTPSDASVDNGNLAVMLGGNSAITITGAGASTVSLTTDTTTYTAAQGEITNVNDSTVKLTANYAKETYMAAESIKSVDATTTSKAVNLDGSATNGVTLLGGAYNDTLTGGTGNDSLDGGAGNDLVNLSVGSATVNVSVGDDTISVASGVKNFAVEGFSTGDAIQLDESFSGDLSIVDGKLSLGTLTIAGISQIITTVKEWANISDGFSYMSHTTAGVTFKDYKITWEAETNPETLFSITGISTITDEALSGTTVTLGKTNLAGKSIILTDGTSNEYKLSLDGNYSASYIAAHFSDVSKDSATYFSDGYTEGYSLASGDKVINYSASIPVKELFTLDGISNTTNIAPSSGVVTVDKINIATGASKVALSGENYKLELSGVSMAGVDTVSAAFSTVTNNSASYIETTETNEFWTALDDKTYNLTASATVTNTLFELTSISNTTVLVKKNCNKKDYNKRF